MNTRRGESIVIAAIVLGFVGAPAFGVYYQHHLDARLVAAAGRGHPVDLYHITGVAKPGMWTLDNVEGWNYWWRKPTKLKEINVHKGDTVVFALRSADVLHGFSLPSFNISRIDVQPGHQEVVTLVADHAGSFPFMCATQCSCTGTGFACNLTKKLGHEGMVAALTVEEPLGPPNATVHVMVSDDKGFQPGTIRVRQGDVVQLTVTSLSNGSGQGVGFCISGYEAKVDLQGIQKGDSRTFKFKANKAGTFMIYSSTEGGPKIDSAQGTFIVANK